MGCGGSTFSVSTTGARLDASVADAATSPGVTAPGQGVPVFVVPIKDAAADGDADAAGELAPTAPDCAAIVQSTISWDSTTCSLLPSPDVLASGLAAPLALAVDSARAYWINTGGSPDGGAVQSVALDGGSAVTLASPVAVGIWGVDFLALDATQVYWTDGVTVTSVPKGGGTAATVATATGYGGYPRGLAVQGGSAIWGWGQGALKGPFYHEVVATPLDGGPPTTLSDGIGFVHAMAVDEAGVCLDNNDTIEVLPFDGGAPAILCSSSAAANLATGTDHIAWTWSGQAGAAMTSAPRDGGAPATLAANGWAPGSIVDDGTSLYWILTSALGSQGVILRSRIDGSSPEVLACDPSTPTSLAVDATSVYWTSSDATGTDGAVRRLPK